MKAASIFLAVVSAAVIQASAQQPVNGAVPAMYRGNAQHTGVYSGDRIPRGKLKWSFPTGKRIRSTAVYSDDTVYFGSDDGLLYALEASSGKLRWKYQAIGAVSSSPAIYRGVVYFEAGDAALYGVGATTGELKWTLKTGPPLPPDPKVLSSGKWEFEQASAVIANGVVYFGSADGNLYALDPLTGKRKWSFKTSGRIRATPAAADGTVFVGSMDGNLYALDASSGVQKWKFKTKGNSYFPLGEIQSSPAVGNGMVYFGSRDGALYALDASTGDLKWKADQENFSWIVGGPALYKDMVIVGTSDAQDVKAYDAKTGTLKWRAVSPANPSNIFTSPTITANTVFVGDFYGMVMWFNVDSGKIAGVFLIESRVIASPIVHDGVLYFGGEDETFYAVE